MNKVDAERVVMIVKDIKTLSEINDFVDIGGEEFHFVVEQNWQDCTNSFHIGGIYASRLVDTVRDIISELETELANF